MCNLSQESQRAVFAFRTPLLHSQDLFDRSDSMVILIADGLPEIELDDLVCNASVEKSSQFHAVVRKALFTNQFMNMQQFASLALDFKAQKVLSFPDQAVIAAQIFVV